MLKPLKRAIILSPLLLLSACETLLDSALGDASPEKDDCISRSAYTQAANQDAAYRGASQTRESKEFWKTTEDFHRRYAEASCKGEKFQETRA